MLEILFPDDREVTPTMSNYFFKKETNQSDF